MLADLVRNILLRYNLTPDDIQGHRNYASYKTCPGRNFNMDKLREAL
jgi:N-acetyl-anhydromuramyl-L-alanine amidase AmpD